MNKNFKFLATLCL
jgi:hypothetical protein